MSEVMAPERADFTIEQQWSAYSAEEHAIWRTLFHRQEEILRERACPEFLAGLAGLGAAFPRPASSVAPTSSTTCRNRTSSTTSTATCRC